MSDEMKVFWITIANHASNDVSNQKKKRSDALDVGCDSLGCIGLISEELVEFILACCERTLFFIMRENNVAKNHIVGENQNEAAVRRNASHDGQIVVGYDVDLIVYRWDEKNCILSSDVNLQECLLMEDMLQNEIQQFSPRSPSFGP